jgi:hypothetical protein
VSALAFSQADFEGNDMYGLLDQSQQQAQPQGLLGDWRQAYAGYQPPPQNVAPPNVQMQQYAPGYYGASLSPEFIGLLSESFGQNQATPNQITGYNQTQELENLINRLQGLNSFQGMLGSYGYQARR